MQPISHPIIRKRIATIVSELDGQAFRAYLNTYYAYPPALSDTSILRRMHEWRLSIYFDDGGISQEQYIESIHWLSNYYK